jgi:predicted nuclease of predicted toxin-antitoxin system
VKLVLDEMVPPVIAEQLRRRGVDAISAVEPAHAGRYAAAHDAAVFARAQEDGRTVVTDNVADFELVCTTWEQTHDEPHHGVLYAAGAAFNRHRAATFAGQMVRSIHYFVKTLPPDAEPFNRRQYLPPAPTEFD